MSSVETATDRDNDALALWLEEVARWVRRVRVAGLTVVLVVTVALLAR